MVLLIALAYGNEAAGNTVKSIGIFILLGRNACAGSGGFERKVGNAHNRKLLRAILCRTMSLNVRNSVLGSDLALKSVARGRNRLCACVGLTLINEGISYNTLLGTGRLGSNFTCNTLKDVTNVFRLVTVRLGTNANVIELTVLASLYVIIAIVVNVIAKRCHGDRTCGAGKQKCIRQHNSDDDYSVLKSYSAKNFAHILLLKYLIAFSTLYCII